MHICKCIYIIKFIKYSRTQVFIFDILSHFFSTYLCDFSFHLFQKPCMCGFKIWPNILYILFKEWALIPLKLGEFQMTVCGRHDALLLLNCIPTKTIAFLWFSCCTPHLGRSQTLFWWDPHGAYLRPPWSHPHQHCNCAYWLSGGGLASFSESFSWLQPQQCPERTSWKSLRQNKTLQLSSKQRPDSHGTLLEVNKYFCCFKTLNFGIKWYLGLQIHDYRKDSCIRFHMEKITRLVLITLCRVREGSKILQNISVCELNCLWKEAFMKYFCNASQSNG